MTKLIVGDRHTQIKEGKPLFSRNEGQIINHADQKQ